MKKISLCLAIGLAYLNTQAQLSPEITAWIQDTINTGSYYVEGNSNTIDNDILVNCQRVEYSDNYVYVFTTGMPSYPTGPFLDRNPSQAEDQSAIYQIPRNPVQNTGTPSSTVGGNIGIFINGVSLFDFRDGVSWNPNTNSLCGGPGNPPCPGGPLQEQDWNRDAVIAEKEGFDCSKGHPANGNYHHHQNLSAFKLDLETVSTICNLYDANGLYVIDSTKHSPLIGYAFDGFPIYGAYGYKNTDGSGGIVRIKSGYQLRNISKRNTSPIGTSVSLGPDVSSTYPLGYFREDYAWSANTEPEYLDEHNGRFCVTPEYPNGTYAYFATVDENWNSAYPYAVGPTFYGTYANRKVTAVNETTKRYIDKSTSVKPLVFDRLDIEIFPNPSSDIIAIQLSYLLKDDVTVELLSLDGQLISKTRIPKGSSIAHFDVQAVYAGTYLIRFSDSIGATTSKKVVINKK